MDRVGQYNYDVCRFNQRLYCKAQPGKLAGIFPAAGVLVFNAGNFVQQPYHAPGTESI
jgi:hypothetical protein